MSEKQIVDIKRLIELEHKVNNELVEAYKQRNILLEAAEEMVAYAERGTEQSYAQSRELYHMHIQKLKAAVERAKGEKL